MHIAVVKQITSILVLVIAAASPCMHAADDEPVLVRSSSVENGVVLLHAEVAGKKTEFECSTDTSKCSAVSPGEYAMVTAGSAEQSYNDCTNVVLYRASSRSAVKEKVGVYCWLNDDCYIADCVSVHVQTVPSNVPDTTVERATNEICKEQGRPDCQQAVAFFDRLQNAISTNDRGKVASMAHFPLRVTLNGKKALVTDKSDLLRHYDAVFDDSVRCILAHARRSDVWGNWQGFTVGAGVAWWERSSSPESSFKLITVNNDSLYKGCGEPSH